MSDDIRRYTNDIGHVRVTGTCTVFAFNLGACVKADDDGFFDHDEMRVEARDVTCTLRCAKVLRKHWHSQGASQ